MINSWCNVHRWWLSHQEFFMELPNGSRKRCTGGRRCSTGFWYICIDYVGTRGFYLGVFPTHDANVKGVLVCRSPKNIVTLDDGVVDLCTTIAWPKWPLYAPHFPSQTQPKPKHTFLLDPNQTKNNTPNAQNAKQHKNGKNTLHIFNIGVPPPLRWGFIVIQLRLATRTPLEGTEAIGDPKDVLLAENGTLFVSDEASHLGGF